MYVIIKTGTKKSLKIVSTLVIVCGNIEREIYLSYDIICFASVLRTREIF